MSGLAISEATGDEVRGYADRRFADAFSREIYPGSAAWVAKDDGTPVGIAIVRDSEDERVIADLYVEPSFRGQRLGAELLDAALGSAEDRTRTALMRSGDGAAVALLARHGIAALEPVYRLAGAIPKDDDLLAIAAGEHRFSTQPVDAATHASALAQLDREVRGSERGADHARFANVARGLLFSFGEELAGYAYLWPSGRIGPLAAASPSYAPQFLAFAMASLRREFGASWCSTLLPGSAMRTMRAALRAGLRVEDHFAFASDGRLRDLARYAGLDALLF